MSNRIYTVIYCLLFLGTLVSGQCPERNILLKRLSYPMDSSKTQEQLVELLPYVGSMNACPYKNDSVHAFLLRRIGGLYLLQGDYLKGLHYYKQFIDIVERNAGKPTVNIKCLLGGYYWLSVFYDSLRMVNEKWEALDNCANIGEKIGIVDRSN